MAKAATKPNVKAQLRAKAEELLDIEVEHRDLFARIDGIKSDLTTLATEAGESFREDFSGKGVVKVSGRKAKEFQGDLPEIDAAAFNALPATERKTLVKQGVVKIVPTWSRAYYGRVSVDLF